MVVLAVAAVVAVVVPVTIDVLLFVTCMRAPRLQRPLTTAYWSLSEHVEIPKSMINSIALLKPSSSDTRL